MIQDEIKKLLERIETELKAVQIKKGIIASGKSAKSLRIETTPTSGTLYGESYFYQQQNGRKAGKMPPVKPIYNWLAYKKYGLSYKNDKQRKSLAFAIALNMKKKGTLISRNKSKGLEFEKIIEKETKIFADNLKNDIKNRFIANVKKSISK